MSKTKKKVFPFEKNVLAVYRGQAHNFVPWYRSDVVALMEVSERQGF